MKRKYHIAGGGGARGYTPFGIETAKGATAHDLKEFWHVGRDLPAGHPFRDHMPDNVWPDEVPSFRDTFSELFATFDRTGLKILRAIARYLEIDEDYFVDTVRDGNSVMRLLHYPPIEGEPGSHVRAGAHEDINTITLLLGAEEAGLELQTMDGRWIPVSAQARRAGRQHRRHAAAADQRPAALDLAPRGQPAARAARQLALLDALLPPLPLGFPDRGAAGHGAAGRAAQMAADHRQRLPPGAAARDQAEVGA